MTYLLRKEQLAYWLRQQLFINLIFVTGTSSFQRCCIWSCADSCLFFIRF